MIEKPNLADEKIIAALCENYGLPVTSLEFLQLGNDDRAWVYKVLAENDKPYFLKVRKGQINEPSLRVPRYLSDHGIEQVVAPFANQSGALWTVLDSFALILYPFIDGEMGAVVGMSETQWLEFGTVVGKIHALPLDADFTRLMRRETFVSFWMDTVQTFQATIAQRTCIEIYEKEFVAVWNEQYAAIQKIIDRTLQLGRLLQNQSHQFVLCHADIHTYNVLVDHNGKLFIIDWDETIVAPKERDLAFVGGGIDKPAGEAGREVELFYQGYGKSDINRVALSYYHYEWVIQELGSYAHRMFLEEGLGEETRKEGLYYFRGLFQPGSVADVAYQSEATLPPEVKALFLSRSQNV